MRRSLSVCHCELCHNDIRGPIENGTTTERHYNLWRCKCLQATAFQGKFQHISRNLPNAPVQIH